VRGFKIGVTKSLGESPWHRNYHERVIRNTCALDTVRAYIRNNPAQWDVVRYGEPRFFAGNRKLLDLPLTAYLASRTRGRGGESAGKGDSRGGSRGESKGEGKGEKFFGLTGGALTAAGDISDIQCVVSGFLSPMERDVLRMCLAEDIPAVQVLARGLPQRFPALVRRAVDVGRLLVMTPFGADVTRVSAERAVWCNQYAMYLAQLIVIGKLSSGGLLDCLLSDLPANKPIQILSKQQDCQ